jgi:hypothetical protein
VAGAASFEVSKRAICREIQVPTPKGKLVWSADRAEMMIQCLRYELGGSRGIDDF